MARSETEEWLDAIRKSGKESRSAVCNTKVRVAFDVPIELAHAVVLILRRGQNLLEGRDECAIQFEADISVEQYVEAGDVVDNISQLIKGEMG